MTKAELIAEKSSMKIELQNLRTSVKGVFSYEKLQQINIEIDKINIRMSLIDKELEIINLEEAFAKEQAAENS